MTSRCSTAVAACLIAVLAAAAPASAKLDYFGSNGLTYTGAAPAVAKQTAFNRLTGAGMNAVRVEMPWSMIQPTSGSAYDWNEVDSTFAALPTGVKAMALFNGSPTWARDTTQRTACGSASPLMCRTPPAESRLADWQRFVKAALARYGSKITAVEVWNEPNYIGAWQPRLDPGRWARLMHATATAVRSVRPDITMVAGGIIGGLENNAAHVIGPMPFYDAAYAAVPKLNADIDAYGFHPYSRDECGTLGNDSWMLQRDFTTDACASTGWDIQRLKYVLGKYDSSVKIAITEFGFHTQGPYAIDEASQRDWLVRAYDWFSSQPDISMLFLHTLFDTSWEPTLDEMSYGMVDVNNRPKPAWTAFHAKLAAPAAAPAAVATRRRRP